MAGRKEYNMTFRLDAQMGTSYSSTFAKAQSELAQMQKEIQALNTTQANISGYQKQQSSVEATRQKLAVLQKQYDNIQREIQETGGFSSTLENKLLSKKAQIDKTSASLKENEEKLEKMGQALRDAGVDTDNLTDASRDLEKQIDKVKEAQEEAAEKARKHGDAGVSAIEDLQSTMVAAGIAKMYKEIAEEAVECVKASTEYESALTGVYKTVDGTPEQLAAINREIKEMATDIPATTTEIAAVAESAGQLGIATDYVMDFTRVMIDLGESTNLSADEAASSLAKFSNITGMLPENYSRLGSVVVGLGNNFATTEADIVAMATRLASSGTLAGFTEAEIMALATAMSSVGIEAEAGGTAMTQTLSAIEKAVAERGKDLKEFARISGMSAEEFAIAWETSPIEAMQAFMTGVGGLEEKGESAVLVLDELGLSGVRQSNMIKSLGLASDTLTNSVITANDAWEENNALSEEAGKRYATTESRLAMLKNSYTNLQIAIGDVYNPALQEAIYLGQDMLDGTTEFVEENPQAVKAIVATTVGLGAASVALGGYITLSKAAVVVTKAVNTAMKSNPYLLAGAAILGVTAALGTYILSNVEATEQEIASRNERKRLAEATEELKQAQLDLNEAKRTGVLDAEANAFASEKMADKLDALFGVENKTVLQKEELVAVVEELNKLMPDLNLSYDKEKDVLSDVNGNILTNTSLIRDNIEAQKEQAIATVYMDDYIARLKEAKEAETTYNEAIAAYHQAVADRDDFLGEHVDGNYKIWEMIEQGQHNDAVAEARNILGEASAAWKTAQDAVGTAWQEYETVITNFADTTAETVSELDQSAETYELGKATGQAYANGLKSSYPQIRSAISDAPKWNASAFLGGDGASFQTAPNGYAVGTDYANPGWAMVGEEGPELVYFGGGEKVYTADETRAMLSGDYTAFSFVPLMQSGGELSFESNRVLASNNSVVSAMPDYNNKIGYTIDIVNNFNIEGDASPEMIDVLNTFGDSLRQIVREELDDIAENERRNSYV